MIEHLTVLLVEDNSYMRALLRAFLYSLGITTIHEARNGSDALGLLRLHNPDVVITDLSMKPMNGMEFTKYVRNREKSPNPYIPIIMVTGHTQQHRVETARDCGVTEFLAKPITSDALAARLREIVERPRPFITSKNYFGPDRRRRRTEYYSGPRRRSDDAKSTSIS